MTCSAGGQAALTHTRTHIRSAVRSLLGAGMIRIFPDFSVQVTAAAAGAGAAGMPAARVPGATNGNPQNVQGLTTYQQRYVH